MQEKTLFFSFFAFFCDFNPIRTFDNGGKMIVTITY